MKKTCSGFYTAEYIEK